MIDKKYIELMNREIDKQITDDEKIELHNYLSVNESANEYYNELLQTNEYLNHIPDREPSENLKKQIINSINFSKYPVRTEKKSFWNILTVPRMKLSYTFAAGLIIGIIVFSLISNNSNNITTDNEFGTIGIENSDATIVKDIAINRSNITGNIQLKKYKNNFLFDVDLISRQKIEFKITYPQNIVLQGLNPGLLNNIDLSKGDNFITSESSGIHQYKLIFSQLNKKSSSLNIQVMQLGNVVFEDNVLLKN